MAASIDMKCVDNIKNELDADATSIRLFEAEPNLVASPLRLPLINIDNKWDAQAHQCVELSNQKAKGKDHSQALSMAQIKAMGKHRSKENLEKLIKIYPEIEQMDLKREIISSIGRQQEKEIIFEFISKHIYNYDCMELVYQMYRTILYNQHLPKFAELLTKVDAFYKNEVMDKMKRFWRYRHNRQKKLKKTNCQIAKPLILSGDSGLTLKTLANESVNLVFTSPPYYNARLYANYKSYSDYLEKMRAVFEECNRILEDGRFLIINVSPVITRRPGREFESIRYPIHFDFHNILTSSNFYFIDEIIWIKPESTVPNRIGGYQQTRKPLSYKPNCITESIMVYRKNADYLLDKNIAQYEKNYKEDDRIDTSNCWYINPKSDKNHPAVFPEELCRRVLKYYSFKGDIVLDPFAGSGTFGKVAMHMRRTPVLCEQNPVYIDRLKREFYAFF